jgi:uncharacterized membrane protein YczE
MERSMQASVARLAICEKATCGDAGGVDGLVTLGPVAQLRAGRLPRRLVQLYVGLVLYGLAIALSVRGHLGTFPWDVLHAGMAKHLPITLGQALIVVSVLVVLIWIPLRELPGLGTVSNAVVLGLSADAFLAVLDQPEALWLRGLYTVGAVVLCAFATAMYIGAQLGRGPRDGLMTGLARRTGWSLRLVRTGLEVTVVLLGLLLGGVAGLGTILFALAIGPLTQAMLPAWIVPLHADPAILTRSSAGSPSGRAGVYRRVGVTDTQ